MQSFIKVEKLTKSYGGLKAIEEITLEIRKGEILSLVGDNGAGKSTFVKTLAGAQLPDSGHIEIDGEAVRLESPKKAGFYGIGCLHQGLGLIDTLNVPENVFLGRELQKKVLGIFPQLDYQRMRTETRDLLNQFSIKLPKLNDAVVNLSGGQRQRVGLARAFYKQTDVLILDEATSALDDETELAVMDSIESFDEELTVVIIAHRITTLRSCDMIIKLGSDYTMQILSYEELINLKNDEGDLNVE